MQLLIFNILFFLQVLLLLEQHLVLLMKLLSLLKQDAFPNLLLSFFFLKSLLGLLLNNSAFK